MNSEWNDGQSKAFTYYAGMALQGLIVAMGMPDDELRRLWEDDIIKTARELASRMTTETQDWISH